MSDSASARGKEDSGCVIVPPSATLVTSPNSPFGEHHEPLKEDSDEEGPEVIHETSPSVSPSPPTYQQHPRYFYEDGNIFIAIDPYLFCVHKYLFFQDDGNLINELLRENGSTERCPIHLPEEIKISSFESVLSVLYRHPLDRSPLHIKLLKDACLTSYALKMSTLCHHIANYIIDSDCPDECLDDAVPKYILSVKLPLYFPQAFKNDQVDKLCLAVNSMSHSNFYELGFHELSKVWKASLIARAGYDGQKRETYQPQPEAARQSYLLKPKNEGAYRAIKKELFGISVMAGTISDSAVKGKPNEGRQAKNKGAEDERTRDT